MASDDGDDGEASIKFDPLLPGSVALSSSLPKSKDEDVFRFQTFSGALKNLSTFQPQLMKDMQCAFTSTSLVDDDDDDDDEEEEEEEEKDDDGAKDLGVSSGETYWISAAMEDKEGLCNLEALALEIFNFHCKRLGLVANVHYDPSISGAEWWTLFIEGDAEVGLHWDKDYTFESVTSMDLFPHLATVTYLTGSEGGQAPTIILDHTPHKSVCGENADEINNSTTGEKGGGNGLVSEAVYKEEEEEEEEDDVRSPYATGKDGIKQAWISSPQQGKHVCFNGRMLHGGMTDLADFFDESTPVSNTKKTKMDHEKLSSHKSGKVVISKHEDSDENGGSGSDSADGESNDVPPRVTLLVNLWFNWKPLAATPLPSSLKEKMQLKDHSVVFGNPKENKCFDLSWPYAASSSSSSSSKSSKSSKQSKGKRAEDIDEEENVETENFYMMKRKFKQRGCSHYLNVPLPSSPSMKSSSSKKRVRNKDGGSGAERQLLAQGASAKVTFHPSNPARVEMAGLEDCDSSDDSDDDSEDENEDDDDDDEEEDDDWHKARLIEFLIKSKTKKGVKAERVSKAARKLSNKMSEDSVAWCEEMATKSLEQGEARGNENEEAGEKGEDVRDGGIDEDADIVNTNEEFEIVD